jgi:hypothetical protein
MKLVFISFLLGSPFPLFAESFAKENERFLEVLRQSETASAIAAVHVGSFRESALNALANRIQDDNSVIQKTLRDTARARHLRIPRKEVAIPSASSTREKFLRQEIAVHEKILKLIRESSSPVLKNIERRIDVILDNARRLERGAL